MAHSSVQLEKAYEKISSDLGVHIQYIRSFVLTSSGNCHLRRVQGRAERRRVLGRDVLASRCHPNHLLELDETLELPLLRSCGSIMKLAEILPGYCSLLRNSLLYHNIPKWNYYT